MLDEEILMNIIRFYPHICERSERLATTQRIIPYTVPGREYRLIPKGLGPSIMKSDTLQSVA